MQLSPELLSDSVLVVDDDVEALEEMAEALQSYGLTVHTAINESMALKLAKEHRPKFIITDYLLDGYTGTEVVSAIHKFLPGTQTIIISAVEGLSRLVTTVNSDIITVLKKPFSIDLLSLFICNKLVQKHQQFRPSNSNAYFLEYEQMTTLFNCKRQASHTLSRLLVYA